MRKLLPILGLLVCAIPCGATITRTIHSESTFSSINNPALTITAPSVGHTLIAEITCFNAAPTVTNVTHGADTLTQATSARGVNGSSSMSDIWYVLSTGNTGTTVNFTLSGACSGNTIVVEYSTDQTGITFSSPAAGTSNLASTSTPIGASASTSTSNGFMVTVEHQANQNCTSELANGGQTYASVVILNGGCSAELLNKPAASYAPEFQLGGADATVSISNAAFNETSSAAGGGIGGKAGMGGKAGVG